MSTASSPLRICVIGAGAVGLCVGVRLVEEVAPRLRERLDLQIEVTVVAEHFSPDTTSDVSAALWGPWKVEAKDPETNKRWAKEGFEEFYRILCAARGESNDPRYVGSEKAGARLLSGYELYGERPTGGMPDWSKFVFSYRECTAHELERFPKHKYGEYVTSVLLESSNYLVWLKERFERSGGKTVKRRVNSFDELKREGYDYVFNCTGAHARDLTDDPLLGTLRGQNCLIYAPNVTHFMVDNGGYSEFSYLLPRRDGTCVAGCVNRVNDWSRELLEEDHQEVIRRVNLLEPETRGARVIKRMVGLRPIRPYVRIEFDQKCPTVIHNYGHGGGGLSLAWPTSGDAVRLLERAVVDSRVSKL